MNRWIQGLLIGVVLTVLLVPAASAKVFTVTLTNGTTFETRYRPEEVEWDENLVLVVTDRGNQIALRKDEIADVTAAAEVRGFGYQLNTTTIFVGFSPNDLVTKNEEGKETSQYQAPDAAPSQDYSLSQFINTPVAGQSGGGGIPLYVENNDANNDQ